MWFRSVALRGVALLLVVSVAALVWRFALTNGLVARYYLGPEWSGAALLVRVDDRLSSTAWQARAARLFLDRAFSIRWQGFLLVESSGRHKFSLRSADGSWLLLDGQVVVNSGGEHAVQDTSSTVHLDAGLHRLEVKYFSSGGDRILDLRWAFDAEPLQEVPRSALFPTRAAYWIQDGGFSRAGYWLPLACSGLLLLLALSWAARSVSAHLRAHRSERLTNAALVATLALSLALFIPAMSWGLPDFYAWAPDEIIPADVLEGLHSRFSGGWHGPYPPLHYYVLSLLVAPFHALGQLGLTDLLHGHTYFILFLLMRATSVAMALGTVYVAYLCAMELHQNRTAGIMSAVLVASMPPFIYYSKLANVEMPYIFWFALSLLCFIRFVRNDRSLDLYAFAVAATLAVCTKDQAYAFYVLPALYLLWVRRDASLFVAGALACVTFVLGHNLFLNYSGFLGHLRVILSDSTHDPVYSANLNGHIKLIGDEILQIAWSMGWPSLIVCVLGLLEAIRRRLKGTWVVASMMLSCHLFLIAILRYHFDRFFLGICLILALFGGRLLADLGAGRRGVLTRRLACAAILSYAVLYGSGVNAVMLADSRYQVESWFQANVSRDSTVGLVGLETYLPRFPHQPTFTLPASLSIANERRPDVIVTNVQFACREEPGTERYEFYAWLNNPDNGLYVRAFAYRSTPWWPILAPDSVFRSPCENFKTNVSKINPEIHVFRRIGPRPQGD